MTGSAVGEPPGALPATVDRLVVDAEQLGRRAADLTDQNLAFRAWLLGPCAMPDAELDALVAATARHMATLISCTDCGRCCKLSAITVDRADTERLARRLGLSAAQVDRRYLGVVDGERCMPGPCKLQQGLACSVYEARPKACRDFPYLEEPGFRRRLLLLISAGYYCPLVFNTLEALKRRLPWRAKRRRSSEGRRRAQG